MNNSNSSFVLGQTFGSPLENELGVPIVYRLVVEMQYFENKGALSLSKRPRWAAKGGESVVVCSWAEEPSLSELSDMMTAFQVAFAQGMVAKYATSDHVAWYPLSIKLHKPFEKTEDEQSEWDNMLAHEQLKADRLL